MFVENSFSFLFTYKIIILIANENKELYLNIITEFTEGNKQISKHVWQSKQTLQQGFT